MRHNTAAGLAALTATAMLLASASAAWAAEAQTPQVTFTTALRATTPGQLPGYYPGTLKLYVAENGIVQGWYYPYATGGPVPVSGSEHNGSYWLLFGNGDFQVNAVQQPDGKLVGSAVNTRLGPAAYPQTFSFVATPSAAS